MTMKLKKLVLLAALTNAANQVFCAATLNNKGRRKFGFGGPCATQFMDGNLGAIEHNALQHVGGASASDKNIVKNAAAVALQSIMEENFAAAGDEVVYATNHDIPVDADGNFHVRFRQYIKQHPVEGATMMMHISNKDGTVYALNGEFSPSHAIDLRVKLPCIEAVDTALGQSGIVGDGGRQWLTDCEEAAVQGFDGIAHLAFKRLLGYKPDGDRPYQRTLVFASTVTGELLALHPQTKSGKALETWDCNGSWGEYCRVKSNSSAPMTSGDLGVVSAHNFAIVTYDFYKSEYGRDSLDGEGMKLVSYANMGEENNAWWDGSSVTYGAGDGIEFYPFSIALDVVAHELTHGITEFTSNLIYMDESGAINEAMSDIFGAVIERSHLKKSANDTWLLAEDVFINGGAIRNMQDPAAFDNVDYYPDMSHGWWSEVHNNSGIANLAFALIVQGGGHPRQKTNVTVPAINASDFDASLKAAASIFYYANTQCLSESATFFSLRLCTLMFAGEHKTSVGAAWDAVGVGDVDRTFNKLENGIELTGQNAKWNQVQEYTLEGVKAGETATCVTKAVNGDADLYVRFGSPTDPRMGSYVNDCSSDADGSYEKCTTGVTPRDTVAFVGVAAFAEFSGLNVSCFRTFVGNESLMGVPITDQQSIAGVVKYYAMDLTNMWSLDDGEFRCVTFGTQGDADLFFKFDSLPLPYHDETNDCESTKAGSSESCSANYTFNGVRSSSAFVAVHGSTNYEGLAVHCAKFYSPEIISAGEKTYYVYRGVGEVAQYVLHNVKAGETVQCTLGGPGGNGDLYVRFGHEAEPYSWSTANDCKSVGPTINETCTTKPAKKATSAYVAVTSTTQPDDGNDYYYNYNYYESYLKCTIKSCLAKGATCTSQGQCCSVGNKDCTCDGPAGGKRTCKACKEGNTKCTRDSECCSGKCQSNSCKAKK